MCGISGFIDSRKSKHDLLTLQKCLHHRGPDAQGIFFEENVGLAHNRLSIIDLSDSANQPFFFDNLVLVFNGEIYNYAEIRIELGKAGYSFATHSDTEVLLKGFHYWGVDVLKKLIGMFAFAVYNKATRELYLAKDRLGVKPLYYSCKDGSITFASELKAFHQANSNTISYSGLVDYLRYGFTVGANTFFSGIEKLLPGHYLHFTQGNARQVSYWNAEDYIHNPITIQSEEKLIDELEELLISSFKYRMVSDVPVGIFFSGGIDSTALVALLSKHFGIINTFTIGFDDPAFDETPYAKKIANYFKTNHTERILTINEAKERLNDFYKIYDEPFYDSSGIPTSLVSELAREKGMKVVLSSEGGDELFGGYMSYQRYYKYGKRIFNLPEFVRSIGSQTLIGLDALLGVSPLGNKLNKAGQIMRENTWLEFYKTCISTLDVSRINQYLSENATYNNTGILADETLKSSLHPIEIFMLWDLKYLLPDDFLVKIDRATMFHSLESREPFLDHRLVEFCLRLPLDYKIRNGQTKYLLRKVLERYIPSEYFNRPKMGFSIPLFNWFKSDLDNLFQTKLSAHQFSKAWPMIDYNWVDKQLKIYSRSRTGDKELNMVIMWKFLGLMLWRDKMMANG
ncbi:MAG: asparagine synthase (glutamine-hydrolyzing) [Cyclobacteriaceae bacterium]|nr:asparagine synthase (glutamine-hydrolyzing) [Cyclobacteriaceae bacterium]MBX2957446.1 asparagine synthase (glutamine-hydrolyzing) [Cyclobacteriaceae bacterium]